MFPPDLRPPPEPLGFSARPSPTPGALGVPRPNGGRPLGRSGFSARPRAPGVPHPTSARAIFGFPPDHRPPRCPCLPPPTPPAPGRPRAPPPAPRPRAHPCPTARPTGPGHLGFPASPAPSLASPPARTGAAIRVLYRILEMFSTRLNPPQHQIPPLQLGLFLLGAGGRGIGE